MLAPKRLVGIIRLLDKRRNDDGDYEGQECDYRSWQVL